MSDVTTTIMREIESDPIIKAADILLDLESKGLFKKKRTLHVRGKVHSVDQKGAASAEESSLLPTAPRSGTARCGQQRLPRSPRARDRQSQTCILGSQTGTRTEQRVRRRTLRRRPYSSTRCRASAVAMAGPALPWAEAPQ